MTLIAKILTKLIGLERRLAMRAFAPGQYALTRDYFTKRIPRWSQHLAPFRGQENVRALEIGCLEGRATLWLLDNILTHPTACIVCVDIFVSRMAQLRFRHNIAVSPHGAKVTEVAGSSQKILSLLRPDEYDIIYIDGSHKEDDVRQDAALSWPLLKRGSVLIFDDYLLNPQDPLETRPQRAIDDFLKEHESELEILHKEYQVIVRRL